MNKHLFIAPPFIPLNRQQMQHKLCMILIKQYIVTFFFFLCFGLPVLQIVFLIFTPSLVFSSFAKSVSLDDMISWYAWICFPLQIFVSFLEKC